MVPEISRRRSWPARLARLTPILVFLALAGWAVGDGFEVTTTSSPRLTIPEGAGTVNASFQNAKLGIGTTSPSVLLDVEGSGASDGIDINNTATDGDPRVAFQLSGTNAFTIGVDDSDGDKLKIGTTAVDTDTRLAIDGSGDVGIGTTTPSTASKLTVAGGLSVAETSVASGTSNYLRLYAKDRSGTSALYLTDDAHDVLGPIGRFVGARVAKNADQTISSGATLVKVTFSSPDNYDTDGLFVDANDSYKIPAGFPANSMWRIQFTVGWESPSTGTKVRARIRKVLTDATTTVLVNDVRFVKDLSGPDYVQTVTIEETGSPGEEFEFLVSQNSGSNLKVLGDGTTAQTFVSISYLGKR